MSNSTTDQTMLLANVDVLPHVLGFSAKYRNVLGYEPRLKTWVSFTGKCWLEDVGGVYFQQYFREFLASLLTAGVSTGEVSDLVTKYQAVFEKMTKREMPVNRGDFDQQRHLINCLNGTVNLRTGELQPHRAEDKLMNCAPVNYKPDAQCPLFEQ